MKTTRHAAIAATMILSGLLPSCIMPDPMFSENAGMIQDINYPSSKVVGTWVSFNASPFQTETDVKEDKSYYDLWPNGRGRIRQSSKNLATGHSIAMEANLRWEYLGSNRWNVMLPPSSAYKVTDRNQMTMGSIGARVSQVRYYQGNLYDMDVGDVWVSATKGNISELTKRRREQEHVFQLKLE